MAFRVESSIQASYNKVNSASTRVGNWQEEEALREFTGYHRKPHFQENDFHRSAERVIAHSDSVEAKDYKTSTHVLHTKPDSYPEHRFVGNMGPRAQRKLEEIRGMLQDEEEQREYKEQLRKKKGDYLTVTKSSYPNYDPELTRVANPRVEMMRNTLNQSMSKTVAQQRVEDKSRLENTDFTKQEAVTIYSLKVREGIPFERVSAAGGANPFGRSTMFTNDIKDGSRRHAEASDCGGLAPTGLGPTVPQRTIVERVRTKILERVAKTAEGRKQGGFRSLAQMFRQMDASGDNRLDPAELKAALEERGIGLSDQELNTVVIVFDLNKDGSISLDEFLQFVRGTMGARRRELLNLAYDTLDRNRTGRVTLENLQTTFDAHKHPDVMKGRISEEQALQSFMDYWETNRQNPYVSREEFLDCYADISCSIDDDNYWELMIRNCWGLSENR